MSDKEIKFEIPKSKMDVLLNKVRALDEMRVPFTLDRIEMMESVITAYKEGIENLRDFLIEFEDD